MITQATKRMIWKSWLGVLALSLASVACLSSAPPSPVPSANDIATVVQATMEALQSEATATVIPPTGLPPAPSSTQPPVPPTLVLPPATRLSYMTDATAGVVMGTIQPGQTLYYVLNAAQGQPMIVDLSSTNNDVTMTIKTAGGTSLLNDGQNLNQLLPVTEDYYFAVSGAASAETFQLSINIPARIEFALGKTTATLSGKTAGGFTISPAGGLDISYVLFADQGQQMDLNLNGVGKDGVLAVYGFGDGQPYLRYVTEQTSFSLKLPASEDYIIQVVPRAGMVINYTLVVSVK